MKIPGEENTRVQVEQRHNDWTSTDCFLQMFTRLMKRKQRDQLHRVMLLNQRTHFLVKKIQVPLFSRMRKRWQVQFSLL